MNNTALIRYGLLPKTPTIWEAYPRYVKKAALGGNGNDQSFEKVFSDIAHTYVQDNAPSLMKYEQGFQLLEKNDDDTKAVGIIGFNVNQMQIYCPVFFLNGEIKGQEMMYLADQDLFVPVDEGWLNEIMGKKPIVIGDGIDKNTHRRGYNRPDLTILKQPPIKVGSFYPQWAMPAISKFIGIIGKNRTKTAANLAGIYKAAAHALDFRNYLDFVDSNAVYRLKEAVYHLPMVKQAYETCYGNSDFLDKVYNHKDIKEKGFKIVTASSGNRFDPKGNPVTNMLDNHAWVHNKLKNPIYKSAEYVTIISYTAQISGSNMIPLTSNEREELARKGFLVMDNRKDSNVSKITDRKSKTFENPTCPGFYDVVLADNNVKKFLILPEHNLFDTADYNNPNKTHYKFEDDKYKGGSVVLIDPSSHEFDSVEKTKVWCTKHYPREDYRNWMRNLSNARNVDYDTDSNYFFIRDNEKILGPKEIHHVQRSGNVVLLNDGDIQVAANGSSMRTVNGTTYIPADTKVLRLAGSGYKKHWALGTPTMFKAAAERSYLDMKVTVNGDSCAINGTPKESKFACLSSLIRDYGLREKEASAVIKKADKDFANGHTVKFTIKRAEELDTNPESAFAFPEPNMNGAQGLFNSMLPTSPDSTQEYTPNNQYFSTKTGPYANTLDATTPQQDAQALEQAASEGQKEVFDVSLLKQLITNVNTSDHIDSIVAQLIRGMDKVARLLFLFYWKGDEFKELYGPQDLPELEGGLRKAFETLGDIILFLKRKSSKPITYSGAAPIDLSNIEE